MSDQRSAADLPNGSVVASENTVWIARIPADGSPRWEGNLGALATDDAVDHLLNTVGAQILRVGTGRED